MPSHTLRHTLRTVKTGIASPAAACPASQAYAKPQQSPKSGRQGPQNPLARPAYRPYAKTRCRPFKSPATSMHQNGAKALLASGLNCGSTAPAPAPSPVHYARSVRQARAYGGVGVRRIGLGASDTRYKFSFYFPLGLGSAIRLASHSRRASLSAVQATRPCRSVM